MRADSRGDSTLTKQRAFLLISALGAAGCRTADQKYADFIANGKSLAAKKDYPRATIEFKGAIRLFPNKADAYYQLALASMATGDLRTAAGALQKTTELDPKNKDAQLKYAQLMTTSQDKAVLTEAAKRAQEILADSPADPIALSTLAAAEWGLGQREEAEKHLEEAFQNSPQNLQSSVSLARLRILRGDYQGAEEVLKKLVEADSKSIYPVLALSNFYIVTKRLADAERTLQRALEIAPRNGVALLSMASVKFGAGAKQEAEELSKRASLVSGARFRPVYAIYLFRSGQRERAVAEFERLANGNPQDRQARTHLVSAYLATGRRADAEKALQAALQQNPKDLDALVQRSQVYLLQGKYAEAEADLSQVLRMSPDSAVAHVLMARTHQGRKSPLRQRQSLAEALRLAPGLLEARLEMAQLLTSTGNPKSALDLLNEAPASQKDNPALVIQRNWANLAAGQTAEAERGITQLLKTGRNSDVLVQNGVLKLTAKDSSGARQSAEEILKTNPEHLNALKILAQSFAAQNQTAAALERVQQHARQHPKSVVLQLFLGEQLVQSGDLANGRKAFLAAKALDGNQRGADLSLAQLDIREGKLADARKTLSARIAADASDIRARTLLAIVEHREGNYFEAVEEYRKVLAVDEQNIGALNNLAYLLNEYANQPDEALTLAEKARQLAPENPAVLDTLGWIYYGKGQYPTAVQNLERAVAKQATPERKGHLGLAYFKSGERERGRKLVYEALSQDPNLKKLKVFQTVLTEMQ
jgi:tetratricopeptide (TPR) repeat protein